MTGRLLLHIGTHKTGSTTLQHVLRRNRSALRRCGVAAIEFPAGFGDLARRRAADPALVAELRAALRPALETDASTAVVSWEGFSGDSRRGYDNAPVMAEQARAILEGHDVRVLVYLRRQDELIESVYVQQIHGGASLAFDEFLAALPPHAFDWERFLTPWAERFGTEALVVRPYDRRALPEPDDLVHDFLRQLGLAVTDLEFRDRLPRLNRGYDRVALEIARRVNPRLDAAERTELRRRLQATGTRGPHAPHGLLTASARAGIVARHAAANDRVAARFVADRDPPLFEPPPETAAGRDRAVATPDVDELLERAVRMALDDPGP